MTKISDRGVRRTKKALKKALLHLMEKNEFHGITITQIVNEADYTRGTFYFHYTHKDALLDEVIEDILQELIAAFRYPYKDIKKEVNIDELSTTMLCDHFLNNKNFYKLMLNPNSPHNFRLMMIKTLENMLRNDISFSASKPDSNIDNDLFVTYRINGIIAIILEWINNNFSFSREYMAQQIVSISTFHTPKIFIKTE